MSKIEPSYHLPPNFSTPPNGPFHLGTVIRDFDHHAKMRPLNQSRESRIEIPADNIYSDHKGGFEATRARLKSGELGVWAKFVGMDGIGAEASVSAERNENDTYKFESVDTTFFYPTPSYISKAMKLPDVQDYLSATNYKKPVFLVSGLKVAKGVSVQHGRSTRVAAEGNFGVTNPEVAPVQVGSRASVRVEDSPGFSFSESSDIIVGIQCFKVYYKTSWLSGEKKVKDDLYLAGATFLDDEIDNEGPQKDNHVLANSEGYRKETHVSLVEDNGRSELWIIPKRAEDT